MFLLRPEAHIPRFSNRTGSMQFEEEMTVIYSLSTQYFQHAVREEFAQISRLFGTESKAENWYDLLVFITQLVLPHDFDVTWGGHKLLFFLVNFLM